MLAQADFQRALALALGEFAPAWAIVGDCAPVDRADATHWGSGPQSFQVTLRHRVTGHVKVLGRRTAYEPGATVHPAVALSLIGAYRHGNSEPIRAYLGEVGVAAPSAADTTHFFRRPAPAPGPQRTRAEPAEVLAAGLAVAAPIAASRTGTSVIGEVDGAEPHESPRSWSLKPRWPSLLTLGSRAPSEERAPNEVRVPREARPAREARALREESTAVAMPSVRRSMRMAGASQTRAPMLGRLRRELQIWYWRRGAGNALDKKQPSE